MQNIHAFFDESGSHAGSPVLCVAGYAFGKREARLLANEWRTVLRRYKLPFFHMVDCAHGNDIFSSLRREQRISVATSLIEIIKRRAVHGFAVSVDVEAYHKLMPEWAPTRTPYAFCARCIIDEMGKFFRRIAFKGRSSYFFEAGHQSRSEAEQCIKDVLNNPLHKISKLHYGYESHAFISKLDAPAVQAADILAWQWATDIKHSLNRRSRRKDFESLREVPIHGAHFDEKRISYYVTILKEFGLDKNHESDSIKDHAERLLYIHSRAEPYYFL